MIVLQTKRLNLRHFTADDKAFVQALYRSPGFLNYIGDRGIHTEADALVYINTRLIPSYQNLGFGLYLVEKKEDLTPIGTCGLVKRDTLEQVDLGYGFLDEFFGQGFAYEACAAVIDYADNKLGLSSLLAIVQSDNAASIALLSKLNFHYLRRQQVLTPQLDLDVYRLSVKK
jgi:[ribosomal protein S5]-alanine N-acetyltransferase